jgi:hypothetical protein
MEYHLHGCPKALTKHKTPLHWVAEIGNAEAVEVLLDAGADLHARDNNGASPLIRTTKGYVGLVVLQTVIALLERGSDADMKRFEEPEKAFEVNPAQC